MLVNKPNKPNKPNQYEMIRTLWGMSLIVVGVCEDKLRNWIGLRTSTLGILCTLHELTIHQCVLCISQSPL